MGGVFLSLCRIRRYRRESHAHNTERNEKLFEKKAKKQIKVGTWEYRQLQDYRKRESGWGKALVFHFTSLSTKKKTLPSN